MRTRTTDIVDIKPGIVEIKGKAIAIDNILVTSLVQRKTVLLSETVLKRFIPTSKGGQYKPFWTRRNGAFFLVDDGTARIKIDSTKADLILNSTVKEYSNGYKKMSQQFVAFLQKNGFWEMDSHGNLRQHYQYIEKTMDPDQEVFIFGRAVDKGLDFDLEMDTTIMPYTITKHDEKDIFIISDSSQRKFLWKTLPCHLIISFFCGLGVLFLLGMVVTTFYILIFIP